MVAKIFHEHGLWVGDTHKQKKYDYDSYENNILKGAVKREWLKYSEKYGKHFGKAMNPDDSHIQGIHNAVLEAKPQRPWLFKMFTEGYKLFLHLRPKIILIYRDIDEAVKSMESKNRSSLHNARRIYEQRLDIMKKIEQEHGAVWVNTDELIEGDYKSLENAFKFCGMELNPAIVNRSIDKQKWHYRVS